MSITVTYKSRFRQIGQEAEEELSKIVRKTAFNVESGAKQNAPVDTGFLRASVFTVTDKNSGQQKAEAEAKGKADREFQGIDEKPEKLEALVAVGAEYGVYVEYGTTRAPAQPYLTPAVESVRGDFERECAKALAGNP